MKYKAIIFDLDGTIIATEHIWEHATTTLITSRGIPFTPELRKELSHKLHGLSTRESCQLIKNLTGITDPVENLIREKMVLADQGYKNDVCFVDGFEVFHEKASNLKLSTAVATNAQEQTVAITNNKLNLIKFFGSHIYNIGHVNFVGKPNPAIYLHAARQLGIEPHECIAIEDSAHGIQAAKSAGMLCIGINTAKKPDALVKADLIMHHYAELDISKLL